MTTDTSPCQICGHALFAHVDVLWPELVQAWNLTPAEAKYIDVQQGTHCARCGSNVRSQALAKACIAFVGENGTLDECVRRDALRTRNVLEVNEAGSLTPWLSQLPHHVLAKYPECDLTRLPYPDETFDLVVHSDTLEHVPDPPQALRECRRVLTPRGACIFTVPVIVGRVTRSRTGLPPSFHGSPTCREEDFLVHTEFGADVWAMVIEASFATCELVPFRYPSGIAIIARR